MLSVGLVVSTLWWQFVGQESLFLMGQALLLASVQGWCPDSHVDLPDFDCCHNIGAVCSEDCVRRVIKASDTTISTMPPKPMVPFDAAGLVSQPCLHRLRPPSTLEKVQPHYRQDTHGDWQHLWDARYCRHVVAPDTGHEIKGSHYETLSLGSNFVGTDLSHLERPDRGGGRRAAWRLSHCAAGSTIERNSSFLSVSATGVLDADAGI